MHPALDADLRPATDSPGGAGKVAETIDRNDDRLVEGRHVKRRGQMREMMLDGVEFAAKPLARKGSVEKFGNSRAAAAIAQPIEDQPGTRRMGCEIGEPAQPVGAPILIDCDMRDIVQPQPRFPQAISDRLGRKSGPVLDAPEALLFSRGQEHAVADERRRGIAVKRVESEDDHGASLVGSLAGAELPRNRRSMISSASRISATTRCRA